MKSKSIYFVYLISLFIGFQSVIYSGYSQTFTEQTDINLVGISESSVAWGDYDNDGDLDILLTGRNSSYNPITKIFSNNGDNTFIEQTSIVLKDVYSGSVDWGDYNNDGNLDILLTGMDNTNKAYSKVYRNNGNNTFTDQTDILITGVYNGSVVWGDYDNDGKLDVFLTGNKSTNEYISKIFRNNGDDTFTEQTEIKFSAVENSSIVLGDYDNDNYLDLLLTGLSVNGPISKIYHNNGNNTFTENTGINLTGVSFCSAAWGDYNNDGYLDILLTGRNDSDIPVSVVFKNIGGTNFIEQTSVLLTGVRESSSSWADFNNDGYLDIILSGNTVSGILVSYIYINQLDNTFTKLSSSLTGIFRGSIALGDYDNDKDIDILLTGEGLSKVTKIYRNDCATPNSVPSGVDTYSPIVNDSQVSLKWKPVIDIQTPSLGLSYNLRVGSSAGASDIVNPNSFTDGIRKIGCMGNLQTDTGTVLCNLKKGTYYWSVQAIDNSYSGGAFSTEQSFVISAEIQASNLLLEKSDGISLSIQWSRGNGTSCIVFVKQGNSGTASLLNNHTYTSSAGFGHGEKTTNDWYCVYKGTGSSVKVTNLGPDTVYVFQVIEFEGNSGNENYYTTIGTNNPKIFKTSPFEEQNIVLTGIYDGTTDWCDFDNDGDLDILLTGTGVFVYRNNGNNTFDQIGGNLLGAYYSSSDMGDYDNDGLIDIAINGCDISYNPFSKIFHNNGDLNFTEQTNINLIGAKDGSVAWGDYDSDGDLDILITGDSGSDRITKIYRNNGDNTFNEQLGSSIIGVSNSSVAWGDYDKDGNLDFIVAGLSISNIPITKLYHNNGNGIFSDETNTTIIGLFNNSVAWCDFNNDGYKDIFLSGASKFINGVYNAKAKIYLNNKNRTFTELTNINIDEMYYCSSSIGDFDNNGYSDIIITGYTGSNYISKVYQNNGNNTFSEIKNIYINETKQGSVAWGDYNNDGRLDILIAGYSIATPISIILKNYSSVINSSPSQPTSLTGTLDGHNLKIAWNRSTDLQTTQYGLTYNVRIGSTSEGVQILSPMSISSGIRSIPRTGNDGSDTSFIIKNILPGKYYWSVQAVDNGYKASSFAAEQLITVDSIQPSKLEATIISSTSLKIKWVRGNGQRCLVFCKNGLASGAVPVFDKTYLADNTFGNGDQVGSTGWYCIYNGRADSVLLTGISPNYSYTIHVIEYVGLPGYEKYFREIRNDNIGAFGTGLLTEQNITLQNISDGTISWGDYDNDGFLDILIVGTSDFSSVSKIYRNNGNNTFSEQANTFEIVQNGSAAWADFDNDGFLDVTITGANSSKISKIYHNNGNNSFSEQTNISLTPVSNSSVAWGDYDNDGNIDLILTGFNPSYALVTKIFRNNDNHTFSELTTASLTGVAYGSANWGDFNNDGYLDVLLAGFNNSKIYRNIGSDPNRFRLQPGITIAGVSSGSSIWVDYDNDGDLDILRTGKTSIPASIIFKNENNTFIEQTNIVLTGVCNGFSAWGDYDNDGNLDLILTGDTTGTNAGSISKIYHNNGNNTFTQNSNIIMPGVSSSSVTWGDYDNDGDLDLLLCGYSATGRITKIYRNNTVMKSGNFLPNNKPLLPVGLTDTVLPNVVQLKWNPVNSDETNAKTMSYNVRLKKKGTAYWFGGSMSAENGYRRIPAYGNAQLGTDYIIKNLGQGIYYWQVQAVDQGCQGGNWSVIDSFEVKTVQVFFKTDTICLGLTTHFTDQSISSDGIASWNWDFKDGSTSTLQNSTHTYASSGTYNVKLVITSTSGLKDSIQQNVIVKSKPNSAFDANTVCFGTATSFTNTTNLNGLTASSWYWNFGNGQTQTISNPPNLTYLSAQTYPVELKVSTTNGCSDSITHNIIVADYPAVSLSGQGIQTFCEGGNYILSVPNNSNYTYQWKKNNINLFGQNINLITITNYSGYYKVSVSNTVGNCTSTSDSVYVTVNPTPAIPAILFNQNKTTFCQGDSIVLESPAISGFSQHWKRDGMMVSNSLYCIAKQEGRYSLTITNNTTGCFSNSVDSVNVMVNEKPVIPVISTTGKTTFCSGDSVLLSIMPQSGVTYQWKKDGGNVGTNTNLLYAKASGNYSISLSNNNGCGVNSSNSVTVTVNDKPSFPSISVTGNTTFCSGDSVKLNIASQSGVIYQWKKDGGTVGTNSSQMYAKSNGLYTLTLTNASGCFANSPNSVAVSVNDKPNVPSISTTGSTTFCAGDSVKLDIASQSSVTYQWKKDGGNIGTNTNLLYAKASGNYSISLSNNNGCGVNSSNSMTVTVNEKPSVPSINTTGNTTFCLGDSVKLDITSQSGVFYQWKRDGGTVGTNTNQMYAKSNGLYTITLTNSSGCFANSSNSIAVTVNDKPTIPSISTTGNTTFCTGDSVKLDIASQSGVTYQWKRDGGNVGANTRELYAKTSGNYTISLVNGNDCGVNSSNAVTVTVNDKPNIPIINTTGDTTFCEGDSVRLETTEQLGVVYTWKINNGTTGKNANLLYAKNTGTYSLTVNLGNCPADAENKVKVTANGYPAEPVITFVGDTVFCAGGSLLLNVKSQTSVIYQWLLNGTPIGENKNSYAADQTGTYSIGITNLSKCTSTTTNAVKITVNKNPEPATIKAADTTVFCQGGSVTLSTTGQAGVDYNWKKGTTPYGDNLSTITAKETGQYGLTLKLGSCSIDADNTIGVNVIQTPTISSFKADGTTSFCSDETRTLTVATDKASNNLIWYNGEQVIANESANDLVVSTSGSYTVKATNTEKCSITSEAIVIKVTEQPVQPVLALASQKDSVCPYNTEIIMVNNASDALTYQWTFNDATMDWLTGGEYAGWLKDGLYKVTAVNDNCQATSGPLKINLFESPVQPEILAYGPKSWIVACDNLTAKEYKWYYNGNLIEGATTYKYKADKQLGEYYVEVRENNECFTPSDIISIPSMDIRSEITGSGTANISIFPNPSTGVFNISNEGMIGSSELEVSDVSGKVVYKRSWNWATDNMLDLNALANGIYFLNFKGNDKSYKLMIGE